MNTKFLVRIVLLLVLVAGISLGFIYREQLDINTLQQAVEQSGVWAPFVFILVYAVATVFFLPGSVLTLTGGVLFGPLLGTFCNLTGATLGATLAFLVARYLASDWIAKKTGGRVKQLIKGVEGEGWRFVAFVRLVPLFPFNLLNYALGLTQIHFLHYLLATYVFMLPGALAYTWLGYAGSQAITGDEGMIKTILIALALFAVVAFLPRLVNKLRRGPGMDIDVLRQRLDNKDILLLDVRTAKDFAGEQGAIEGAFNIPVEELPDRLQELGGNHDQAIALICRTDKRSAKAAQLLSRHGYHDVNIINGGMTQWLADGLPVVK